MFGKSGHESRYVWICGTLVCRQLRHRRVFRNLQHISLQHLNFLLYVFTATRFISSSYHPACWHRTLRLRPEGQTEPTNMKEEPVRLAAILVNQCGSQQDTELVK